MLTPLEFFKRFYSSVADHRFQEPAGRTDFSSELQAMVKALDLLAANKAVALYRDELQPNTALLNLYDRIADYQDASVGEPFVFDEDHPLVIETAAAAERITGGALLDEEAASNLINKVDHALLAREKMREAESWLQKNAGAVNEYRLQQLEHAANNAPGIGDVDEPSAKNAFTHAQQAIAIQYLLNEALDVSNVDTTRLMEFAHVLAAKPIPIDKATGKLNIRNSGIKTAFNKAWKKEDANHLADLRFVLRYFQPLNVEGAVGINRAVTAIEKRIAKISEKLSRNED